MALSAELILAIKEGSILTAAHFVIQWLVGGWASATPGRFPYLVSGYSLLFYVLNLFFSVSRRALDPDTPGSWLVGFSRFTSTVFEQILNLGAVHIFASWIPTRWSPMSYIILGLVQIYSVICWVFNFGVGVPRSMVNNGISSFVQPDTLHKVHQIITTAAALWFIVRHIAAFLDSHYTQTTSNEPHSIQREYANGSDEQQRIYLSVKEIAANCTTHWRKYFTWGCQLEEGASLEQIIKLDLFLDEKLPNDYKIFLKLTNGLKHVLDGSKPHLTFLSADSPNFAVDGYQHPNDEMRRQYRKWLVDAMFGPGTYRDLCTQTGHRDGICERKINLIKIASRNPEEGGVFLVHPKDVQNTAKDWVGVGLNHEKRNGALIGRIYHHTETYFGDGFRLERLKGWEEWLVLQVQRGHEGPLCRLYPSFTVFLQTMAEITRRYTSDLMSDEVLARLELSYAEHCCLQWEHEWTRESGEDRGIGRF